MRTRPMRNFLSFPWPPCMGQRRKAAFTVTAPRNRKNATLDTLYRWTRNLQDELKKLRLEMNATRILMASQLEAYQNDLQERLEELRREDQEKIAAIAERVAKLEDDQSRISPMLNLVVDNISFQRAITSTSSSRLSQINDNDNTGNGFEGEQGTSLEISIKEEPDISDSELPEEKFQPEPPKPKRNKRTAPVVEKGDNAHHKKRGKWWEFYQTLEGEEPTATEETEVVVSQVLDFPSGSGRKAASVAKARICRQLNFEMKQRGKKVFGKRRSHSQSGKSNEGRKTL